MEMKELSRRQFLHGAIGAGTAMVLGGTMLIDPPETTAARLGEGGRPGRARGCAGADWINSAGAGSQAPAGCGARP